MHVGCTSVPAGPLQEHCNGHKAYMTMSLAFTENNRTLYSLKQNNLLDFNDNNILSTIVCFKNLSH